MLHDLDAWPELIDGRSGSLSVREHELVHLVLCQSLPAIDAHLTLEGAIVLVLADVRSCEEPRDLVRVVDDQILAVDGEAHGSSRDLIIQEAADAC